VTTLINAERLDVTAHLAEFTQKSSSFSFEYKIRVTRHADKHDEGGLLITFLKHDICIWVVQLSSLKTDTIVFVYNYL
jgi:hypothetical protein